MPLPKEATYTIDDIYALPEGERAELIDDHIFYMAPPITKHQRISSFISWKISDYIHMKQGAVRYLLLLLLYILIKQTTLM